MSNSHSPDFFLPVFLRKFLALGVLGVSWAVISISGVVKKYKLIYQFIYKLTYKFKVI